MVETGKIEGGDSIRSKGTVLTDEERDQDRFDPQNFLENEGKGCDQQ